MTIAVWIIKPKNNIKTLFTTIITGLTLTILHLKDYDQTMVKGNADYGKFFAIELVQFIVALVTYFAVLAVISKLIELRVNKRIEKEKLKIGVGGFTTLMWASANGLMDVINAEIESGVDVNTQDNSGGTALMYAVRNNQYSSVEMLIKSGSDHSIKTTNGMTIERLAKKYSNKKIISLIGQSQGN
jgi:ankyrin repeat protein